MNKQKIFISIALNLLLAITGNSQIGDVVPSLKINCPTERLETGRKVRLSAEMKPDAGANTVFNWAVSNASITSGQGTKEIEIQSSGDADSVTASVEISASFAFQTIRADCTFQLFKKPVPIKIDEMTFYVQGELKARLDNYFNQLMNDPTAQGFIVIYPPSSAEKVRVERVIRNYIKVRNFDTSRIVLTAGKKRDVRSILHFWLVPAGADFEADLSGISEPQPQRNVGANPSACELNGLHLSELRRELSDNPNANLEVRYLDGKGETETVNKKRIELTKNFLEKYFNTSINFVRSGKATGNAEIKLFMQNPGRDEIYSLRIYAIKNKSICFACCDTSDMPKNLVSLPKKKGTTKKKK